MSALTGLPWDRIIAGLVLVLLIVWAVRQDAADGLIDIKEWWRWH